MYIKTMLAHLVYTFLFIFYFCASYFIYFELFLSVPPVTCVHGNDVCFDASTYAYTRRTHARSHTRVHRHSHMHECISSRMRFNCGCLGPGFNCGCLGPGFNCGCLGPGFNYGCLGPGFNCGCLGPGFNCGFVGSSLIYSYMFP